MAVESISSLFVDNPISSLTADYMFEVAGDAGDGVVSGATKFSSLKSAIRTDASSSVTASNVIAGTFTNPDGFTFVNDGADNSFSQYGMQPANGTIFSDGTITAKSTFGNIALKGALIQFTDYGSTGVSFTQYGGTTSSFPGLKRSSTELQCRLADDSGYAPFRALGFTGDGSNVTAVPGAMIIDTGWTANIDAGDKTQVILGSGTRGALATTLNILSPGLGDDLYTVGEKVKALEITLKNLLVPNA